MGGQRPSADAHAHFCYTAALFIYGIINTVETKHSPADAPAPAA